MRTIHIYHLSLALLFLAVAGGAMSAEPVARWSFDSFDESQGAPQPETSSGTSWVRDDISGVSDRIVGYHRLVQGVAGEALRLGGINSYIERDSADAPRFDGPFTIEAWIAIGAYPVNWCPIVGKGDDTQGIVFGVDGYGHVGLQVAVDGQWQTAASDEQIGLREWAHVACTFEPGKQMIVYLNGKPVAMASSIGIPELAAEQPMFIGMNPIKQRPQGTLRNDTTGAVHTHFDGLVDELEVYDRA